MQHKFFLALFLVFLLWIAARNYSNGFALSGCSQSGKLYAQTTTQAHSFLKGLPSVRLNL